MSTLEHVLAFESCLGEWIDALSPQEAAEDSAWRRVLVLQRRVYDAVNNLVADSARLQLLDERRAHLEPLRDAMRTLPPVAERQDELLRLGQRWLDVVGTRTRSGAHCVVARSSVA